MYKRIGILGILFASLIAGRAMGQDAASGAIVSTQPRVSATPAAPGPKTYGTTATSFQRVGNTEFVPLDSSMTYSDFAYASLTFSRYPTNAAGAGVFVASPHLPSGALVSQVEFDWCDTNVSLNLTLQVWSSSYTGENATKVGETTSSGSAGCSFSVATLGSPFTIDNNSNQLVLLVYVPTQDGTTSISGAIMRYKLQVSPAPGMATFNDVPTGDFAFQYIEALVASGITGGCGSNPPFVPPVYCPDAFVTRRQMAIFIAKALGLQWQ